MRRSSGPRGTLLSCRLPFSLHCPIDGHLRLSFLLAGCLICGPVYGAPACPEAKISDLPNAPLPIERAQTLSIQLGENSGAALIRVDQRGLDVRWRIYDELSAYVGATIDAPHGWIGSEFAVVPISGPAKLCIWSEDPENERGAISIELLRPKGELDAVLRLRAQVDVLGAEPDERIARYVAVAERFEASGATAFAADTWLAAGVAAKWANQPVRARLYLERAVSTADAASDTELAGWARYRLGSVLSTLGKSEDAREIFFDALKTPVSDPLRVALENYVGLMFHDQGRLQEANSWYRRALESLKAAPYRTRRAMILNNMAGVHYQRGEAEAAAQLFEEAVSIYEEMGNQQRALEGLKNAALAYIALGNFREAFDRLVRAADIGSQPGYERGGILEAFGAAFAEMGDSNHAREHYAAALSDAHLASDVRMRARLERELGALALESGEMDAARAQLTAAINGFKEAGDAAGEFGAGCDLLDALITAGDTNAAQQVFTTLQARQALIGAERLRPQQACLLLHRGRLLLARRDSDAAQATLSDAAVLMNEIGDTLGVIRVATEQARGELASGGDLQRAIEYLNSAHQIAEQGLLAMSAGRYRRSFLDATRRLLDMRVAALWQLSNEPGLEAFEASAAGRGRILRASILGSQGGRQLATHERRRLAALRHQKVRILEGRAASASEAAFGDLLLEISLTEQRLADSSSDLRARSEPLLQMQAIRDELEDDELIIHFHVAEDWGLAWLIEHEGSAVYDIPGERSLAPLVSAARMHWSSPSPIKRSGADDPAAALAQALLGPIQNRLPGRRLYIVPDRSLHLIPFAGLSVGDGTGRTKRLAEIVAATSRLPWPGIPDRRALPMTSATIISVPSERQLSSFLGQSHLLPGASREIKAISAAFGSSSVLVDAKALMKPSRLQRILRQPTDVLHISAHAYAHPFDPGLSSISVDRDPPLRNPLAGSVSALEVPGLGIKQRLVVLSACETAVGPVSPTEGPVSLTHAFLEAGATQVLSTLWRVPDVATARFSELFYGALQISGISPADALHKAQQAMLADRRWRHPYYWAAFVHTSASATIN